MTLVVRLRHWLASRAWPALDEARGNIAYYVVVELAALAWAVFAVARENFTWHTAYVLLLLIGMALAFEEGVSRAARLQLRLSKDLKRDMCSVWAVAGAVALEPGSAVVLLSAILVYVWFRQQRPAGQFLYRKLFNAGTYLIGGLTAGTAVRAGTQLWSHLGWVLAGAVPVIAGIAIFTITNRLLVTVALVRLGVRGRGLIGSRDDNLIELATLCLGGLVAIAVLNQPVLAILVIAPMVTLQRGALMRELETAASTDAKTGLLNPVAWEHLAQRELARAQRENYGLGVLIIDIDRFKRVNDEYGHLVGDHVLRGVGRCIETEVREYDGVGRFGGEEFVAVLPDVTELDALVIAERVRTKVNELRICNLTEGVEPREDDLLSVSIGVSCAVFGGAELPDLLREADAALYRAKASGRNRVVLAEDGATGAPDRAALA